MPIFIEKANINHMKEEHPQDYKNMDVKFKI